MPFSICDMVWAWREGEMGDMGTDVVSSGLINSAITPSIVSLYSQKLRIVSPCTRYPALPPIHARGIWELLSSYFGRFSACHLTYFLKRRSGKEKSFFEILNFRMTCHPAIGNNEFLGQGENAQNVEVIRGILETYLKGISGHTHTLPTPTRQMSSDPMHIILI